MTPLQMEAVALSLGLRGFDLLVVADGSGMRLDQPCGWACYLWYPAVGKVWEHLGGTSGGTNNYAELAPFAYALWHWHYTHFAVGSLRQPQDVKVELVSDSELTVRCGNGLYHRNANLPLWASIDWFETHGYALHWTHVPRNSTLPNKEADRRGKEVRTVFEKYVSYNPTN